MPGSVSAPPQLPEALHGAARAMRLLALDVDGVLTNGSLVFSASGDEQKSFNILDGLGIKLLQRDGIEVALITGRTSPLTERRAADLGIRHLLQGREDKARALTELAERLGLTLETIAYMGDDLPDLGAIRRAALGITVPNGHWFVRQHADWCTRNSGGSGAVREVADALLAARGTLEDHLRNYL